MTAHVGVSHTPFHLMQLGMMMSDESRPCDSMVIFHEGEAPDGIPGLDQAQIIELPGFQGFRSGRKVVEANVRIIRSHPSWSDDAIVFLSDLRWLTNNRLYFTRSRRHRAERTFLISDGLGSYVERHDAVRTTATACAKMGMGLVGLGPRHRPVRGHHLGQDRRYVAGIYGLNAREMVGTARKIELQQTAYLSAERLVNGPSMVLGVPLDLKKFGSAGAERIVDRTAHVALEKTPAGAGLLYKPHHFEADWIRDRYCGHGFELVADRRSAELVIRDRQVRRLFGAFSSALVFGPRFAVNGPCEAFSVCFDEMADVFLDDRDRAEVTDVMSRFGVVFL